MYEIEFYETEDGKCPIWDFLEALRLKAPTNKDARIQHKQASLYIELLQQNGTHMNMEKLFDAALAVPEISGIILNPWNRTIQLDKTLVHIIKGA